MFLIERYGRIIRYRIAGPRGAWCGSPGRKSRFRGRGASGRAGIGPGGAPQIFERSGETRTGAQTVIAAGGAKSEEHTSELQSLMRISYAVFCLNKKNDQNN